MSTNNVTNLTDLAQEFIQKVLAQCPECKRRRKVNATRQARFIKKQKGPGPVTQ